MRYRQPVQRVLVAFTLVELLVVIAIIGILVALLLPAVQAAREAARRTQCKNQMKQFGIAIHNHADAMKMFPTGGTGPWPLLEDYSVGGKPAVGAMQGLGWMYQILPYIENSSIANLNTSLQVVNTPIEMFLCPSRRSAQTVVPYDTAAAAAMAKAGGFPVDRAYTTLNDYAAANPCGVITGVGNTKAGTELGPPAGKTFEQYYSEIGSSSSATLSRRIYSLWQAAGWGGKEGQKYYGVIARSPYSCGANHPGKCSHPMRRLGGATGTVSFKNITDGTSKTLMLGEKLVRFDQYEGGGGSDDRGWSDGWDPDTIRSTCVPPWSDSDPELTNGTFLQSLGSNDINKYYIGEVHNFGSAHPGVMNVVYADASVQTIGFDIDHTVFNLLGDRRDGYVINQ